MGRSPRRDEGLGTFSISGAPTFEPFEVENTQRPVASLDEAAGLEGIQDTTGRRTGQVRHGSEIILTDFDDGSPRAVAAFFPGIRAHGQNGEYRSEPALGPPSTARDILNRLNEVSFNAVLLKELRMIAMLRRVADPGNTERPPGIGSSDRPLQHDRLVLNGAVFYPARTLSCRRPR
ncbi:hypothetical protein DFO45_4673 [Azorhizobium sp. AG788]|nr:hypothetical protein DFO45_4673 [Azorhizobium sp. AG788]